MKLQGPGFYNLMSSAGYRRRDWRWMPLVASVFGGIVFGCLLAAWMVTP